MSCIGHCQFLAGNGGGSSVGQGAAGHPSHGRQDKSADLGRAHVVGWVEVFGHLRSAPAGAFCRYTNDFNDPGAGFRNLRGIVLL